MNLNHNSALMNFGNTCFMNASIQLLMCAKALGSFLIIYDPKNPDLDINKYIQTWKDYMSEGTNILGPKILYHRYMVLNTCYTGFTQEDSHEFLIYTLDDILEQIKKSVLEQDREHITQLINKIYTIKFSQSVFYKNKNETSTTNNNENILSLPVSDATNTLSECYNLYKHQEEDDFIINYEIIELPKYLFLGLKRFRISNGTNIEKITKQIDIPLETDIFGHNYRLKGFIMHVGGVHGGHYYTYGSRKINDEIKWFRYDDRNVSETDLEHIKTQVSTAYIYLYSKFN